MVAATTTHHHRSSTYSTGNKAFKSRHAPKGLLRDKAKGKVEKSTRRALSRHVMSKADRRNQAKQRRLEAQSASLKSKGIFTGKTGAPKIIAVVPLCSACDSRVAVQFLNNSLNLERELPNAGHVTIDVERFKQKAQYILLRKNLLEALNAGAVADYVIFLLSADEEVDDYGETMIRAIERQGISDVHVMISDLEPIQPAKRQAQVKASLKAFVDRFFPTVEKFGSLGSRQDCLNLVQSIFTTSPKGVNWRDDRSWMLVEDVRQAEGTVSRSSDDFQTCDAIISGVIRGKKLNADQLVHLADWGDYKVEKITAAPLPDSKQLARAGVLPDANDQEEILSTATEAQESLLTLAPESMIVDELEDASTQHSLNDRKGVLLDDHHYFSDGEDDEADMPKRLPRGTSRYQSAWYLGDHSDSGSDMEDVETFDDSGARGAMYDPADGAVSIAGGMEMDDATAGPSEYAQSEMFQDPSPDQEVDQLTSFRNQRQDAREDLEFPDEIELDPNALARERLMRYRGLKNFRTSKWQTEEDVFHRPTEWPRLLEIANYKAAKSKVRDEHPEGVSPGTRVCIHVQSVPTDLFQRYNPEKPFTVFSLLRHEQKHTALNYSILLHSDFERPLKSKEEIIVQCGPRRMSINPLFSDSGHTANDVHKFSRYLHPGRSAIATCVGPMTWGSVPLLYFKRREDSSLQYIGTGTSLAPSTSRVIAKRIVLTGHPFKIHKKLVTVRYMFFNSTDVAWFKALRLWTKGGRSGFIKESLGTHGYFKATFDGKINPMDAVAISLYKRVWPRTAKPWRAEHVELTHEDSMAVE